MHLVYDLIPTVKKKQPLNISTITAANLMECLLELKLNYSLLKHFFKKGGNSWS